ncbi:AraC family transcriptional regulator [Neorhizobium sp. P12A]|uniref:helix-turn-helix domain-containing protein n=1 Tax=Neorhizobium sp. P12A TaxID=2268027 RepID=UPI0011EE6A60|nr:AraC family transcriptional regulator [Neorhizobium sp. P12A]KAA0690574.1 AraC family transcriptional regulator [Neorhizobium sp. P12A]
MLTSGHGVLLQRRYSVKNPPTLISHVSGSNPITISRLLVDSPQLTLKAVPGEAAYALPLNHLDYSTFNVRIDSARTPQRHTIGKGTICLWDLTVPPAAFFENGFNATRLYLPFTALKQFAEGVGARHMWLRMDPGTDDPIVRHLLDCLAPAFDGTEHASALFVDYITLALQTHLLQHYGSGITFSSKRGGLAAWQLRRAQEAMAANLRDGLSIDDLARDCGLSNSHFARAFRQSTGKPPHRWFTERRIDAAKELLLKSTLTIPEIASASGFASQSHMTRTFTRFVGTSPAAWRRERMGSAPFGRHE